MSVLIIENGAPTFAEEKQMKVISTSPSTSFAFALFFEASESYFRIKLAIL